MLDNIRRDLEGLLGEREYAVLKGADPLDAHRKFPLAGAPESRQGVEDALVVAEARAEEEPKRRMRMLRAGVTMAWLERETGVETAAEHERMGAAPVKLADGTVSPQREVKELASRNADRGTRQMYAVALAGLSAQHEDTRAQLAKRRHEAVQKLGWKNMVEFFERMTGLETAKIAAEATTFLDATKDAYRENLKWLLERHEASLDTAEPHDLDWIRHDLRKAGPAPRDKMLKILEGALKWMGLPALAGGRLHKLVAPLPPTTLARRKVPGEIYLSLFLEDGIPAWSDNLAAWGRALHAAMTTGTLPLEDRALGDPAVPRAWGDALASAPYERDWIARVLDFGKAKDLSRELFTLRLHDHRRQAALTLWELEFHGPGSSPADFASRLSDATLTRTPASASLESASPFLETAHHFRASRAAAAITTLLERRFESWYRNPETGPFLMEAWLPGRRYPLADLLDRLQAPDPASSTKRFLERLA